MNEEEAVLFLFGIAREIKRSFESPVILLTMKDYAACIFNSLVDMRTALLQNAKPERVVEIVNTFHFEWLQAVQDIENFKKRVTDTPRESIQKAIEFTIHCVQKRHHSFNKYIEQLKNTMTPTEKELMQTDLGIIGDMEQIINFALIEKKRYLSVSADRVEFYVIVSDEIEELLNWLDRLNDYLAINMSKVIDLKVPELASDLTKTLQEIINEVAEVSTPEAQKVAEELGLKGRRLGSMARVVSSVNDVKISMIVEKIQNLEKRISRLKNQKSSAVMALQHKAMYLEDRLQSLENLKVSVNLLRNKEQIHKAQSDKDSVTEDDIRIFNHLLPHQERCRLVEQLVKLWEGAIIGENKSIISILSASDIKEVFSDELGNFSIDKYGRKIYKKPGDDGLYQLNENNELVLMRDDDKHVYFFDECGRYYLDRNRMRVYKAHGKDSEYMLHRAGFMLKLSEFEDGIQYYFDNLGRFYLNEEGQRIYREKGSQEKYVFDGLGNLEKLYSDEQIYTYCPIEPIETPASLYLKKQVGDALKTCLADVIIAQPLDPIKYLADRLEKYYYNKQAIQHRLMEEKAMLLERELIKGRKPTVESVVSHGATLEEQSITDYDFIQYETNMV